VRHLVKIDIRQGLIHGIVTGVLLVSGTVTAEEIYRWVDENGVVNYTQLKPRGTEAETITTKSGGARVVEQPAAQPAAQPMPTSAATGQPLNAEQQKMLQGLQAAERARQAEIAKIKEQNCQQSRDVLARLTLKNRIRVKGDDGAYHAMAEDERQERIAKAQEGIALYCAPA
jgi:hypothetical protein